MIFSAFVPEPEANNIIFFILDTFNYAKIQKFYNNTGAIFTLIFKKLINNTSFELIKNAQ
jgi:hypothetical protein